MSSNRLPRSCTRKDTPPHHAREPFARLRQSPARGFSFSPLPAAEVRPAENRT